MAVDVRNQGPRQVPPWMRDMVIRRDGPNCRACHVSVRKYRPHEAQTWQPDHIVPWAAGGSTTLPNLQVLCVPCNVVKGADPWPVFLAKLKAKGLRWRDAEYRRIRAAERKAKRMPLGQKVAIGFAISEAVEAYRGQWLIVWGAPALIFALLFVWSFAMSAVGHPVRWGHRS